MTIHAPLTDELDEVLKALANPVRRQILQQLKDPETNFPGQEPSYDLGVCAGRIDHACGLSQSTVSAHLAVLQHAGLIIGRRIGQWVFYRRNEATIARFLEHMGTEL
jgi:ArsR family transcriptional regulator